MKEEHYPGSVSVFTNICTSLWAKILNIRWKENIEIYSFYLWKKDDDKNK